MQGPVPPLFTSFLSTPLLQHYFLGVNLAAIAINVVAAVTTGKIIQAVYHTNIMWRNLIIQAVYQITVLLIFQFDGRSILHLKNYTHAKAEKIKDTVIFNTFVFCQVFNEFNAQKPDEMNMLSGVMKNRLFIGIIGITVVFQILIIEFLGKFFTTVRLSWQLWLVCLAVAFFSWPLAILGKLIPVPKIPVDEYFKRWCGCKNKDVEEEQEKPGVSTV